MIPKTMDALVKTSPGTGLRLMEVPVPSPGPGEILIKIRKTAICGTDVHIYNWDEWSARTIKPPRVIGHEYVGEIAALGDGVTSYKNGQIVSGEGHIVCGMCRNCRAGNRHWCKFTVGVGVDRDGAFAEYLCIPASNVVPIEDSLDEEIVAFFDAFGNATHTTLTFEITGEDVLITGAGPIGIMAAAVARFCGARNVVITDVNEYRLALAEKMGVNAAVNVKKEDLEQVMKKLHIREGFDVGMEMSGNGAALAQMIRVMRNGGKIALLGILSGADIDLNDIIFKGLGIQGIYGRRMYDTWYKMGVLVEGGLDLKPLITHRYNYRDFDKGFAAMNSGNSCKVVLDWTK